MKAILEFNLPEDRDYFDRANQAEAMHSVLWDMDQWLRQTVKYTTSGQEAVYAEVRSQFRGLMEAHGIDL